MFRLARARPRWLCLDRLPSVRVWVFLTKRLLGHPHLLLRRDAEELPREPKYLVVGQRQRRVDQVGEPRGGERPVERLADGRRLLPLRTVPQRGQVHDRQR